jgi:hypothetical protein
MMDDGPPVRGRLREESGTRPAYGLAMTGLRYRTPTARVSVCPECEQAWAARSQGGSRRCRSCPTILARPSPRCSTTWRPCREDRRTSQAAPCRAPRGSGRDGLANPAAKATETLESFAVTESFEDNFVKAAVERIAGDRSHAAGA